MPSKRGRPPRDQIADDEKIARAVEQLTLWGYSGKGEVFEVVGIAARKVLDRKDHDGYALGPDRIKQLWEEHRPPGWDRHWPAEMRKRIKPLRPRHLWTKPSLMRQRPAGTIQELAEALLEHGGEWPWPTAPSFEPDPSPKWEQALALGFRRVRKPKNGVEK